MQQIALELGSDEDNRPTLILEPEREQRLIALMAQLVIATMPNPRSEDHEGE